MVKDEIIKKVLTVLFLILAVRQYLLFNDIYCTAFLLFIFMALMTTKMD